MTEFKSEARSDLRGRLEATMASEAIKISVKGNNHMDTRVIKVAGFKYEVKLDLWGSQASEATRILNFIF